MIGSIIEAIINIRMYAVTAINRPFASNRSCSLPPNSNPIRQPLEKTVNVRVEDWAEAFNAWYDHAGICCTMYDWAIPRAFAPSTRRKEGSEAKVAIAV